MIHTIGLDADDTLWHNERIFADVEERQRQLLLPWAESPEVLDTQLAEVKRANLATYGYGVKSFTLTMVEFACQVSNHQIDPADIALLISWSGGEPPRR